MNKNKVISNTIMFSAIMLFIFIFQHMFGNENTLVGVTVITTALTLLERDLTISPFKNLIKLLTINIVTGFAAHYASNNMWLGVIINFVMLFMIGYLFSYNVHKSIFVPFGLQYLFILFNPVYNESFFKRILGLIFGAFFVMALQLLFNNNKISKSSRKIIDNIFSDMLFKINLLKENKETSEVNTNLFLRINSLKKLIYDRRVNDFYITKAGEVATNILFSLERLTLLLDKLKEDYFEKNYYSKFLDDISRILISIKDDKFNINNLKDMKNTYINTDLDITCINEFTNLFKTLNIEMIKIRNLNKKDEKSIDSIHKVPLNFKKVSIHKRNLKLDSLRVSYGIRLAIAGVITAFLTSYFHLSEGRWMAYTIFSLIQPYSEISNVKSKQRLEGTFIGALIVYISFSLITNTTARFLIILLAGYLNPFASNYRSLIVCVTVSAVASSAMVTGTTKFVLSRIIFVAIGTFISLLVNKFVLPYKFEDGKKDLVSMYHNLVNEMLSDNNTKHTAKNLFLIPALIEDRMSAVSFGKNCTKEKDFIYNQKLLVNNLYKQFLINI